MSRRRMLSWLLCGACAAIWSCGRSERSPVAPDFGRTSAPAADVAALVVGGGQASGHAFLHGTTVQNVKDEILSFTAATAGAFPQARGELEMHNLQFTGEDVTMHAEMTCMAVQGNVAWVGGRLTQVQLNQRAVPDWVGRPVVFRVVDGGEGKDATDAASLLFFPQPGARVETAEGYCDTRPDFPILRTPEDGNIQVKPQ